LVDGFERETERERERDGETHAEERVRYFLRCFWRFCEPDPRCDMVQMAQLRYETSTSRYLKW